MRETALRRALRILRVVGGFTDTSTSPAIELRGVVKTFGSITAVDGLDLEVPAGICLGLLGPNGAGKSTTMRLLTGQAIADSGEIRGPGATSCLARAKICPSRDGRRAAARQSRRRCHRRGQPRRFRPSLSSRRRRGPRSTARSISPAFRIGGAMRSTSFPAACAGACCWLEDSFTPRA